MKSWFWDDPQELSDREALVQWKQDMRDRMKWQYETKDWPPKPDFDRDRFDNYCQLAQEFVSALVAEGEIPPLRRRSDPRLASVREYFLAYAQGKMDRDEVYDYAKEDILSLQGEVGIALLALQIAMGGFFAMGEPKLGRDFARGAARAIGLLRLHQRGEQYLLSAGG